MKSNSKRKNEDLPKSNAAFDSALADILQYSDAQLRIGRDLKEFEKTLHHRLNESNANGPLALKLLSTAKAFLRNCRVNPTAEYVPFCLAAVDYFLEVSDASPDFESLSGFDDDESVFVEIATKFNLPLE